MGGVFAGLLRLDLNEDPLKEWITRTVEASGVAEDSRTDESSEGSQNDAPQQIEIEWGALVDFAIFYGLVIYTEYL